MAAVAYGWVYAGKNGHAAGLLGSLGVVLVLVAARLDEPRRARRRGPG